MQEIVTIFVFINSYIIGILIGITIINLRQKFKDWNRESWGVPKE